jgi:cardiolipin synthase
MSKQKFFSVLFLLLISILLLSGCLIKLPISSSEPVQISDLPPEALYIDKDAIYNRTSALIQSAQTSIYIQQAEFDDPGLIQLLISKSRAGIEVRIILDQWQSVNQATLEQIKSHNISIHYYPAQKGQINHTKYLIIDQKTAMIYGPPWTADGFQAHDLAVELSGKSAWKAATLFSNDWRSTTTLSLPVPKTTTLPDDNITLAVANVKQQLIKQISTATKSVWIELSKMSDTDPEIIQALIDAADKGLDVRLILGREVTGNTIKTLETLKSNNILVRYYPSQTSLGMHLAIFDDSTFILTSSDWTRSSFIMNHEFSITVPSPTASAKLVDMFKQDWGKSTE